MSIVVWTKLEALEKRVAALEAAKADVKPEALGPIPFARSNAMRKAESERLREEIRRIVGTHAGHKPLSAGAVRRELLRAR